ncbi:unnamed protein product, partial [Didymodactylos carnosus]
AHDKKLLYSAYKTNGIFILQSKISSGNSIGYESIIQLLNEEQCTPQIFEKEYIRNIFMLD